MRVSYDKRVRGRAESDPDSGLFCIDIVWPNGDRTTMSGLCDLEECEHVMKSMAEFVNRRREKDGDALS